MKKAVFEIYQYVAPAVLTPLSFFLWWRTYDGNVWLTLTAWLTPILYAYIVPGVGTNILKVWEFDTRFRLGRFRPHHGFVFGSATASLAWLCHGTPARDGFDILQTSLIWASVLGFWNVLYDVKAIEAGMLRVYNQPWAEDKGAEAITLDYAPWFFAGFGAIYGLGVAAAEWLQAQGHWSAAVFACCFPILLVLAIAFPVWGYRRRSYRVHGHAGCHPIAKE